MSETISAREHYDRLAESGHGHQDPPSLQEYMARWDGPEFFEALGDPRGRDILDVGIGYGRIARRLLAEGCGTLTGLDLSPGALAAAGDDLADFENLELLLGDIADFRREDSFDVAYSVLTFMHVADKKEALRNIVCSLRRGGHVVLSIHRASEILDFGKWAVKLYPWPPERYAEALAEIGCEVEKPIPLTDRWVGSDGKKSDTHGQRIAALVKARKK